MKKTVLGILFAVQPAGFDLNPLVSFCFLHFAPSGDRCHRICCGLSPWRRALRRRGSNRTAASNWAPVFFRIQGTESWENNA
jgi:hypothetical protein